MAMSKKAQNERLINRLSSEVSTYAEVREAAVLMIEALKLDPPKKVKSRKAMEALEKKLYDTSRCGCGGYPMADMHGLRGGMCETCRSS
jgi:hypothetical protein